MNTKTVLQIEGVEAAQLFGKIDVLCTEVANLKTQIEEKKQPTDLLTRKQVAKMFGVTLVTVHDWTRKGLLISYKLANRVYYKREEIEQALTQISPRR